MSEDSYDPTGLELASEVTRRVVGTRGATPQVPPRRCYRRDGIERRSGPGPDDRDPQLLGAVLRNVSAERGWRRRISVSTVLRSWPRLVGQVNAEHSRPVSFDEGVLVVQCDSTSWASGMKFSASKLVARLNAELGQQMFTRIDFRGPNAPSWKKGRRSVRGRGPRDTYG
ncbi:MAG: DUF721 domain-containing protein [Arachnia sp.]